MTCPICASDTDPKYRPFCSKRCADLDLAKWLNGTYSIASTSPEDQAEALDELEKHHIDSQSKPH
ncbi:DNA gyrase inhibitor YacG [Alisedimentitalea sp. MJ-SS2]|uniref:DNA gyrase inhibitor YacG n=1 Tax=Aliisedimentitalea sp. MJ-SS2 TaxID=3049795 RepID=UPI0029117108|nr:DNA gyrase inhibitor YacG [Alisedimentitalea sp. MJ-SS2]MDU8927149.1 DNA gyrase inhibitor YacG [Alisedimentitalea sp. MJ-SS2]